MFFFSFLFDLETKNDRCDQNRKLAPGTFCQMRSKKYTFFQFWLVILAVCSVLLLVSLKANF